MWMWKIRSSWGIDLPAENMLSKLPACSLCPLATAAFTFPCYLSQPGFRHQNLSACVSLNLSSSIVLAIYTFISISVKKLLRSSATVGLCQHLHIYNLAHPFPLASDSLATSAVIISIDFPADFNSK